jgi:hypothetical protein
MTSPQHTLALIDAAITRFDQALDALGQIPKTGELSVTVDGIEHELRGLVERLRSLRDDVAGEDG